MRATFLHMADCHLGHRQYNSKARQNDFTRAYLDIIQAAIDTSVDFVVLAGDLFEKRAIDALTLNIAITGLERLQRVGIPCIAVEGNHELAYYRDTMGWMRFLAERELLILLNPQLESSSTDSSSVILSPYQQSRGAFIDILPWLRVYGMRYYGSATAQLIQRVADRLATADKAGIEYTIFIAHSGVEGVLAEEAGGLRHRDLARLRPHVDYLALGHIHKPYSFDNWIFNPGSPETCSLREVDWPQRGYYLVDVDTARPAKHSPTLHANKRRPFVRLHFKVDHCQTPADLYNQCRQFVERKRQDDQSLLAPVVELRLSGVLPFDPSALDREPLEQMLEEVYQPLHCFVRNTTHTADFAVSVGQHLNRKELERQVIADLLARDSRFRAHSSTHSRDHSSDHNSAHSSDHSSDHNSDHSSDYIAEWSQLALAIKELAITGASPEALSAAVVSELAVSELALLQDQGHIPTNSHTTNDQTQQTHQIHQTQ